MAASALRADSTLSPTLDWSYIFNDDNEEDNVSDIGWGVLVAHLVLCPESTLTAPPSCIGSNHLLTITLLKKSLKKQKLETMYDWHALLLKPKTLDQTNLTISPFSPYQTWYCVYILSGTAWSRYYQHLLYYLSFSLLPFVACEPPPLSGVESHDVQFWFNHWLFEVLHFKGLSSQCSDFNTKRCVLSLLRLMSEQALVCQFCNWSLTD